MNRKYFFIFVIICIVISTVVICTGCISQRSSSNVIKYESKYKKYINKKTANSGVIDLGDGVPVNYNYSLGPQDVSGPNFKIITVDSMP